MSPLLAQVSRLHSGSCSSGRAGRPFRRRAPFVITGTESSVIVEKRPEAFEEIAKVIDSNHISR